MSNQRLEIHHINVGQGDATLILLRNLDNSIDYSMLVDGGDSHTVRNFVRTKTEELGLGNKKSRLLNSPSALPDLSNLSQSLTGKDIEAIKGAIRAAKTKGKDIRNELIKVALKIMEPPIFKEQDLQILQGLPNSPGGSPVPKPDVTDEIGKLKKLVSQEYSSREKILNEKIDTLFDAYKNKDKDNKKEEYYRKKLAHALGQMRLPPKTEPSIFTLNTLKKKEQLSAAITSPFETKKVIKDLYKASLTSRKITLSNDAQGAIDKKIDNLLDSITNQGVSEDTVLLALKAIKIPSANRLLLEKILAPLDTTAVDMANLKVEDATQLKTAIADNITTNLLPDSSSIIIQDIINNKIDNLSNFPSLSNYLAQVFGENPTKKLDAIVITHYDIDHAGGIVELMADETYVDDKTSFFDPGIVATDTYASLSGKKEVSESLDAESLKRFYMIYRALTKEPKRGGMIIEEEAPSPKEPDKMLLEDEDEDEDLDNILGKEPSSPKEYYLQRFTRNVGMSNQNERARSKRLAANYLLGKDLYGFTEETENPQTIAKQLREYQKNLKDNLNSERLSDEKRNIILSSLKGIHQTLETIDTKNDPETSFTEKFKDTVQDLVSFSPGLLERNSLREYKVTDISSITSNGLKKLIYSTDDLQNTIQANKELKKGDLKLEITAIIDDAIKAMQTKKPINAIQTSNRDFSITCVAVNGITTEGQEPTKDFNDTSIALLVKFNDFTYYLGGDLSAELEASWIIKYIGEAKPSEVKFLSAAKISHHGSRHSTPRFLLDTLKPLALFVSSGAHNTYGHPHPKVFKRMYTASSNIQNIYYTNEEPFISDNTDHSLTGKKRYPESQSQADRETEHGNTNTIPKFFYSNESIKKKRKYLNKPSSTNGWVIKVDQTKSAEFLVCQLEDSSPTLRTTHRVEEQLSDSCSRTTKDERSNLLSLSSAGLAKVIEERDDKLCGYIEKLRYVDPYKDTIKKPKEYPKSDKRSDIIKTDIVRQIENARLNISEYQHDPYINQQRSNQIRLTHFHNCVLILTKAPGYQELKSSTSLNENQRKALKEALDKAIKTYRKYQAYRVLEPSINNAVRELYDALLLLQIPGESLKDVIEEENTQALPIEKEANKEPSGHCVGSQNQLINNLIRLFGQPVDYKTTSYTNDCFYEALSEALGEPTYNTKSLRNLCLKYIERLTIEENWVKEIIEKEEPILGAYEKYFRNVQYTQSELENLKAQGLFVGQNAIEIKLPREGRILADMLKRDIHVIVYDRDTPADLPHHWLITKTQAKKVPATDINYQTLQVVHLAAYENYYMALPEALLTNQRVSQETLEVFDVADEVTFTLLFWLKEDENQRVLSTIFYEHYTLARAMASRRLAVDKVGIEDKMYQARHFTETLRWQYYCGWQTQNFALFGLKEPSRSSFTLEILDHPSILKDFKTIYPTLLQEPFKNPHLEAMRQKLFPSVRCILANPIYFEIAKTLPIERTIFLKAPVKLPVTPKLYKNFDKFMGDSTRTSVSSWSNMTNSTAASSRRLSDDSPLSVSSRPSSIRGRSVSLGGDRNYQAQIKDYRAAAQKRFEAQATQMAMNVRVTGMPNIHLQQNLLLASYGVQGAGQIVSASLRLCGKSEEAQVAERITGLATTALTGLAIAAVGGPIGWVAGGLIIVGGVMNLLADIYSPHQPSELEIVNQNLFKMTNELSKQINQGFGNVYQCLDGIDKNMWKMGQGLSDQMGQGFKNVYQYMEIINQNMQKMGQGLSDQMDQGFTGMHEHLEQGFKSLYQLSKEGFRGVDNYLKFIQRDILKILEENTHLSTAVEQIKKQLALIYEEHYQQFITLLKSQSISEREQEYERYINSKDHPFPKKEIYINWLKGLATQATSYLEPEIDRANLGDPLSRFQQVVQEYIKYMSAPLKMRVDQQLSVRKLPANLKIYLLALANFLKWRDPLLVSDKPLPDYVLQNYPGEDFDITNMLLMGEQCRALLLALRYDRIFLQQQFTALITRFIISSSSTKTIMQEDRPSLGEDCNTLYSYLRVGFFDGLQGSYTWLKSRDQEAWLEAVLSNRGTELTPFLIASLATLFNTLQLNKFQHPVSSGHFELEKQLAHLQRYYQFLKEKNFYTFEEEELLGITALQQIACQGAKITSTTLSEFKENDKKDTLKVTHELRIYNLLQAMEDFLSDCQVSALKISYKLPKTIETLPELFKIDIHDPTVNELPSEEFINLLTTVILALFDDLSPQAIIRSLTDYMTTQIMLIQSDDSQDSKVRAILTEFDRFSIFSFIMQGLQKNLVAKSESNLVHAIPYVFDDEEIFNDVLLNPLSPQEFFNKIMANFEDDEKKSDRDTEILSILAQKQNYSYLCLYNKCINLTQNDDYEKALELMMLLIKRPEFSKNIYERCLSPSSSFIKCLKKESDNIYHSQFYSSLFFSSAEKIFSEIFKQNPTILSHFKIDPTIAIRPEFWITPDGSLVVDDHGKYQIDNIKKLFKLLSYCTSDSGDEPDTSEDKLKAFDNFSKIYNNSLSAWMSTTGIDEYLKAHNVIKALAIFADYSMIDELSEGIIACNGYISRHYHEKAIEDKNGPEYKNLVSYLGTMTVIKIENLFAGDWGGWKSNLEAIKKTLYNEIFIKFIQQGVSNSDEIYKEILREYCEMDPNIESEFTFISQLIVETIYKLASTPDLKASVSSRILQDVFDMLNESSHIITLENKDILLQSVLALASQRDSDSEHQAIFDLSNVFFKKIIKNLENKYKPILLRLLEIFSKLAEQTHPQQVEVILTAVTDHHQEIQQVTGSEAPIFNFFMRLIARYPDKESEYFEKAWPIAQIELNGEMEASQKEVLLGLVQVADGSKYAEKILDFFYERFQQPALKDHYLLHFKYFIEAALQKGYQMSWLLFVSEEMVLGLQGDKAGLSRLLACVVRALQTNPAILLLLLTRYSAVFSDKAYKLNKTSEPTQRTRLLRLAIYVLLAKDIKLFLPLAPSFIGLIELGMVDTPLAISLIQLANTLIENVLNNKSSTLLDYHQVYQLQAALGVLYLMQVEQNPEAKESTISQLASQYLISQNRIDECYMTLLRSQTVLTPDLPTSFVLTPFYYNKDHEEGIMLGTSNQLFYRKTPFDDSTNWQVLDIRLPVKVDSQPVPIVYQQVLHFDNYLLLRLAQGETYLASMISPTQPLNACRISQFAVSNMIIVHDKVVVQKYPTSELFYCSLADLKAMAATKVKWRSFLANDTNEPITRMVAWGEHLLLSLATGILVSYNMNSNLVEPKATTLWLPQWLPGFNQGSKPCFALEVDLVTILTTQQNIILCLENKILKIYHALVLSSVKIDKTPEIPKKNDWIMLFTGGKASISCAYSSDDKLFLGLSDGAIQCYDKIYQSLELATKAGNGSPVIALLHKDNDLIACWQNGDIQHYHTLTNTWSNLQHADQASLAAALYPDRAKTPVSANSDNLLLVYASSFIKTLPLFSSIRQPIAKQLDTFLTEKKSLVVTEVVSMPHSVAGSSLSLFGQRDKIKTIVNKFARVLTNLKEEPTFTIEHVKDSPTVLIKAGKEVLNTFFQNIKVQDPVILAITLEAAGFKITTANPSKARKLAEELQKIRPTNSLAEMQQSMV